MPPQQLNNLRAVAIVPCKSLSAAEFTSFIKANDGTFSHIIFSTQVEVEWATERKNEYFSILSFPFQRGISAARNRGLESVCNSKTIFFFPNLSTRFNPDYVAHVLKLFSIDRSIGAISGVYLFKDQESGNQVTGPLQDHQLFLAYEPTLAIAGDALKSNAIKFDEELGTGNLKSKRWSGEGTELLHRLGKFGFKVLRLNQISSFDSRNNAKHPMSVDYKYGRGYIYVTRNISGNLRAIYQALKVINKVIPIKRAQQNNSLNFFNSFAFIFGSWVELLSAHNRKQKS